MTVRTLIWQLNSTLSHAAFGAVWLALISSEVAAVQEAD
jgi:hypothetical protein